MFRSTPTRRRTGARVGAGIVAGVTAVLIAGGAASAHVRVTGDIQGGGGVITFRVPSESATASTTELTVTFPTKTPIVSVATQPMPGWKSTITTAHLAKPVKTDDGETDTYVAKVDWKAENAAAGVPAGEFQLFNVSVDGLPDVRSLTFPALQHYSNGTTANWNEIGTGRAEPAHPAPVLTLAPAASSAGTLSAPSSAPSASMSSGGDDSSMGGMDMSGYTKTGTNWQGITGMITGVLGLIAGLIALARTSRARADDK
jgi:uncharacterized protein